MDSPELIVVMPIYNEEANIAAVVKEWMAALAGEGIPHQLLTINDGSKDRTLALLADLDQDSPGRLRIIDKPNSGHGRSCRQGYEAALAAGAAWIMQVDSDGQCDPAYFPEFWRCREDADCVFGRRVVRDDGYLRKLISSGCRWATALVTGSDLKDANVPYRLIARAALQEALTRVPADFDLQNIALTLALKRSVRLRWTYIPIRFRARTGGINSINFQKIAQMGFRMLCEIRRVS